MSGVREEYLQYALNQLARATELPGQPASPLSWLEFELPLPPSVNRRIGKLGNKSPEMVAWHMHADPCWLLIKRQQNIPTFFCKVQMEMICGVQENWDLDNRIKPMQDYLERVGVVKNDRLIRDVRAFDSEGSVPKGRVIVRLRPRMSTEGKTT